MTTFASVWDAIEDTPEEAENMKVRSSLMRSIEARIRKEGRSAHCAVPGGQPGPRPGPLLPGIFLRAGGVVPTLPPQVHQRGETSGGGY